MITNRDPYLEPYKDAIQGRANYACLLKQQLKSESPDGSLAGYALAHKYYGLHFLNGEAILREYAPNATAIYLIGNFNDWKKHSAYSFTRLASSGNWELRVSASVLPHLELYKLIIEWDGGTGERIPAYANYVIQDDQTHIFSAAVWSPQEPYTPQYEAPALGKRPLLIYEAHVGMSAEVGGVASYDHFRENVLPRIARLGYNAVQLMAIQEHPYYGSFGYHVSSFYAPSSRFGTPCALRHLIDEAHRLGLMVIMDLVHSHAVKNEVEGIGKYDGKRSIYFHEGTRGEHPLWDSLCFDYAKPSTLLFLLSNCRYWLEEYGFDGYRFDGVTSMIYQNHGLGEAFTSYNDYYNGSQDGDAIAYLTLANDLIHEIRPKAITIAEEVSGMPGLAAPIKEGGFGFDFRLAMNVPDYWIKTIKEKRDEDWSVGNIFFELTNRRNDEKTISYVESHDQALVGDKTVIFRLIDKEMYWHMSRNGRSLAVDRGMALTKIIRLLTITTINGGYLNFMGNEFGHPEWIDFPREGNSWSHHYARRQWSLADNKELRYSELLAYDHDLVSLLSEAEGFQQTNVSGYHVHEKDQVMAYGRGDLLIVVNLSPTKSYSDYLIGVPPGKYETLINTDALAYGGFGSADDSLPHFSQEMPEGTRLSLYLPTRSGVILRRS